MRVVHINTFDRGNGAAEAAYRLHSAQRKKGIDSWMFVQRKLGDDPYVIGPEGRWDKLFAMIRPYIDALPKYLDSTSNDYYNDISWLPNTRIKWIKSLKPDVVHLHWINGGFLSIASLASFKMPLVWTCHDTWPLTGIRHYPVIDFKNGHPVVSDDITPELYRKSWLNQSVIQRKKRAWKDINMAALAPSLWMEQQLR